MKLKNKIQEKLDKLTEKETGSMTTYTPDDDDKEVIDAIDKADDEDVHYNDDGSISIKENTINPRVTKQKLIEMVTNKKPVNVIKKIKKNNI